MKKKMWCIMLYCLNNKEPKNRNFVSVCSTYRYLWAVFFLIIQTSFIRCWIHTRLQWRNCLKTRETIHESACILEKCSYKFYSIIDKIIIMSLAFCCWHYPSLCDVYGPYPVCVVCRMWINFKHALYTITENELKVFDCRR